MSQPTRRKRLQRYLSSTRHLIGTGLAGLGLIAHFTGLLGAFWLPIDLGLYLAGALLTPARTRVDVIADGQRDQAELRGRMRQFVRETSPQLTPALKTLLEEIETQVNGLLPQLAEQTGSSDRFTVEQTICDYLPNIVRNYLNMPPAMRVRVSAQLGATPEAAVTEQLELLRSTLSSIGENAVRGDADQLQANGRFLKEKFGQSALEL